MVPGIPLSPFLQALGGRIRARKQQEEARRLALPPLQQLGALVHRTGGGGIGGLRDIENEPMPMMDPQGRAPVDLGVSSTGIVPPVSPLKLAAIPPLDTSGRPAPYTPGTYTPPTPDRRGMEKAMLLSALAGLATGGLGGALVAGGGAAQGFQESRTQGDAQRFKEWQAAEEARRYGAQAQQENYRSGIDAQRMQREGVESANADEFRRFEAQRREAEDMRSAIDKGQESLARQESQREDRAQQARELAALYPVKQMNAEAGLMTAKAGLSRAGSYRDSVNNRKINDMGRLGVARKAEETRRYVAATGRDQGQERLRLDARRINDQLFLGMAQIRQLQQSGKPGDDIEAKAMKSLLEAQKADAPVARTYEKNVISEDKGISQEKSTRWEKNPDGPKMKSQHMREAERLANKIGKTVRENADGTYRLVPLPAAPNGRSRPQGARATPTKKPSYTLGQRTPVRMNGYDYDVTISEGNGKR